ncbi:unnamed protein product [Diamesa serratosioi]
MKICVILLIAFIVEYPSASAIYRGQLVDINQFPYAVSVQYNEYGYYSPICGGTIISDKWILTSAECIDLLRNGEINVRIGAKHALNDGTVMQIKRFIKHPNYQSELSSEANIALIELKSNIEFNENVKAANLSSQTVVPKVGSIGVFVNWNTRDDPMLRKGDSTVMEQSKCIKAIDSFLYDGVKDDQFCAGPRKNACPQDVGSGFAVNGTVIGITLNKFMGCGPYQNGPNVFINIAKYRDWINQQTGV